MLVRLSLNRTRRLTAWLSFSPESCSSQYPTISACANSLLWLRGSHRVQCSTIRASCSSKSPRQSTFASHKLVVMSFHTIASNRLCRIAMTWSRPVSTLMKRSSRSKRALLLIMFCITTRQTSQVSNNIKSSYSKTSTRCAWKTQLCRYGLKLNKKGNRRISRQSCAREKKRNASKRSVWALIFWMNRSRRQRKSLLRLTARPVTSLASNMMFWNGASKMPTTGSKNSKPSSIDSTRPPATSLKVSKTCSARGLCENRDRTSEWIRAHAWPQPTNAETVFTAQKDKQSIKNDSTSKAQRKSIFLFVTLFY